MESLHPRQNSEACPCTTTEYKEFEEYIKVYNRCYDTIKQEWRDATANAFGAEDSGNARLEVQFFWPFRAPYYIIALDGDYQYAMVRSPSREYRWILSKRLLIDDAV